LQQQLNTNGNGSAVSDTTKFSFLHQQLIQYNLLLSNNSKQSFVLAVEQQPSLRHDMDQIHIFSVFTPIGVVLSFTSHTTPLKQSKHQKQKSIPGKVLTECLITID